MSVLKARMVPQIVAEAGMTLKAFPADSWVTEITPDSKGESVRDTMDCNVTTSVEAATIGSMVRCGMAACPPLPCNTMVKSSAAAIKAPGLEAMVPVGSLYVCTCVCVCVYIVREMFGINISDDKQDNRHIYI
mmetsp:Transcript_24845/g.27743  ORF Transcript_24845/g.27743 Transcript_24845/m.27743 type:complete len:133 (-) Transcript_24845:768-1166(-)